jgi:hypothetical protein
MANLKVSLAVQAKALTDQFPHSIVQVKSMRVILVVMVMDTKLIRNQPVCILQTQNP